LSNFLPLEDDFPCCTGTGGTNNASFAQASRASLQIRGRDPRWRDTI